LSSIFAAPGAHTVPVESAPAPSLGSASPTLRKVLPPSSDRACATCSVTPSTRWIAKYAWSVSPSRTMVGDPKRPWNSGNDVSASSAVSGMGSSPLSSGATQPPSRRRLQTRILVIPP
jgi:hypothetical protein